MVTRTRKDAAGQGRVEQVPQPPPAIADPPNALGAHWADRLRERTRELGLTDADVARRLGLQQSRYSNYVNKSREPDLAMFARICRALATTPDAVLGFGEAENGASARERLLASGGGALSALDDDRLRMAVAVLAAIVETANIRTRRDTVAEPALEANSARQRGKPAATGT